MGFKHQQFMPIRTLAVFRRLSSGEKIKVGTLAQDQQNGYFAYDSDYLAHYGNLSPFQLKADLSLQRAPKHPNFNLHGVFADSLPDGWGLLLQDRYFRQQGILPHQLTLFDRLAFVGARGIGSLLFEPDYQLENHHVTPIDLAQLGLQAQAYFDGQTDEVLHALTMAGSSGGTRPKAQIFMPNAQTHLCRTVPQSGDEGWIVKFTSKHLPLGHEEGLCEAVYLSMAQRAHLHPVEWQLLPAPRQSGAQSWLAVKRFDWVTLPAASGRYHVHSVAGLLEADFRSPSVDYEDLLKVSKLLCQSPQVGRLQFARAIFNLFALNQDDHAKNWAFLQDDSGHWQPTPFYDVTFSPNPYGEHMTAFAGYGKNPPLKAVQQLAQRAGFDDWQQAKIVIAQIVDSVAAFSQLAKGLEIRATTIQLIERQLANIRKANPALSHFS